MLLSATPDQPLVGDLDIEHLIAAVPDGHAIKGLFILSSAAAVHDRWNTLESKLQSPPRLGRYLPFSDYPLSDYLRITDAAARKRHPLVSPRQAHRLLSRDVFSTFTSSTLGKVTLSMLSGPLDALTKYQDMYGRMTRGSRAKVTAIEPQVVEVAFHDYYSTVEAVFGVVEGVVMAFRCQPSMTVRVAPMGRVTATVRWTE